MLYIDISRQSQTDALRNKDNRKYLNNLVLLFKDLIREELRNIEPVVFKNVGGRKEGIAVVKNENGVLTMQMVGSDYAYDEGSVGDGWNI